jgi:uncharacterized membrane protein YedE/YeeE
MSFPVSGPASLALGVVFGFVFGWILQRARLADATVVVNQFRLRDFTLLKVMLTAILVGGVGVLFLHEQGLVAYHIKPANLLGIAVGSVLFGIGMAVLGYCPGSGLAAIGAGRIDALMGLAGMIVGAIAYALSFDWLLAHILPVGALGPRRLPDLTGIPDLVWLGALGLFALALFTAVERRRSGS